MSKEKDVMVTYGTGWIPTEGKPRDVFKDGATPEFEASMSMDELEEEIEPEPCRECGHTPGVDWDLVETYFDETKESIEALPAGSFKENLEQRLKIVRSKIIGE